MASLDVDNPVLPNWLNGLIKKITEENLDVAVGKMIFNVEEFLNKKNYLRLFSCVGQFGDKVAEYYGPKTTNNYAITAEMYAKIGGQLLHSVGEETSIGILAKGQGAKIDYHLGEIQFNFRRFIIERSHYFDMFIPRRGQMTDIRLYQKEFTDLSEKELTDLSQGALKEYELEYCILRPLILTPALMNSLDSTLNHADKETFKTDLAKSASVYLRSNQDFQTLMDGAFRLSMIYQHIFEGFMVLPNGSIK